MKVHREIYGDSPELLEVIRTAELIAQTDVNVLITGESGTGKELLARRIHTMSRRSQQPLITVNCASLPEPLSESLLFGHCRGTFTGAVDDRDGMIAAARCGTLLLDEIGELCQSVQSKLLRFIEYHEYQPLGSNRIRHADVRILAATNRNLREEVAKGNFRSDLFHRLNIVPLELPPLRKRSGDIKKLLEKFIEEFSHRHQVEPVRLSRTAQQTVLRYVWPGNIRELRNFCERMVILFAGGTVEQDQLPDEIRNNSRAIAKKTFRLPATGINLESLEREIIREALQYAEGNKSLAARMLGLSRDTLRYRVKKYGLLLES